jgi:hypothetical protein
MSAHTPVNPKGPSCGQCEYRFGQVWLCPLHAAARALLEALEYIDNLPVDLQPNARVRSVVRTALQRARGEIQ